MRKLKTLLIVLFAACLSLTLFACGGGEEEEPGSDLNRVTVTKGIDLTDADEEPALTAKLANFTLSVRNNLMETSTIKGSDCEITANNIVYHVLGQYSITLKPKENNGGNMTANVTVTIDHAWGAPDANGKEVCSYDKATRVTKDEDVVIHYGGFHYGTGIGDLGEESGAAAALAAAALTEEEAATLGLHAETPNGKVFNTAAGINTGKTSSGRIKDFGVDGRNNKKVPSVTAGDLLPGMSITIEGYAKTEEAAWGQDGTKHKEWFAPSYGIADPYATTSEKAYGNSVIVRSEGWVLYNGIGNSDSNNVLGGLPPFIEGLSASDSGSTDAANYGSHPSENEKFPAGFDASARPDPTSSEWKNWWVYSEGQELHSGTSYGSYTPVKVTWTYRTYKTGSDTVGIIEIESVYNDTTSLTSYIKVLPAARGYYRTLIHGDYSGLIITKSSVVETETITDMRVNGRRDGAAAKYLAGHAVSAADIVDVETMSEQNPTWQSYSIDNSMLYYYTGDDQTVAAATTDLADNTKWTAVNDSPLTTAMKIFKVEFERSDKTFRGLVLENGESAITVVANNALKAYADDYDGKLVNRDPQAAYTLALTEGTPDYVDLTLNQALLRAIPAESALSTASGISGTADYRYVTLRIEGVAANGWTSGTLGTVHVSGDKNYYWIATAKAETNDVLVAIALKEEALGTPMALEGLQATNIRVTLGTDSIGFDVTSTVSYVNAAGEAAQAPSLDQGGYVKIAYTGLGDGYGITVKAAGGGESEPIYIGSTLKSDTTLQEPMNIGFGGLQITAYDHTNQTITFKFPKFNFGAWTGMPYVEVVDDNVALQARDYIDYQFEFTGTEGTAGLEKDGVYVFSEGGELYIIGAGKKFATGAVHLNMNDGDVATAKVYDLSVTEKDGKYTFNDSGLDAEAFTVDTVVFGKSNGKADKFARITVDLAAAGEFAGDFGFEVNTETITHYWMYKAADQTIEWTEFNTAGKSKVVLEEGTCLDAGTVAYVVKGSADKTVYLAGYTVIGGEHQWEGNTCELCGATKSEVTLTHDEADWNKAETTRGDLYDGEYFEITGTYNNADHTGVFNGIETNVRQGAGSNFYVRVRNDGYYAREAGGDNQAKLLYNSTSETHGVELGTCNGVPNGIDGTPITEASYLAAKKEGSFKVTAFYTNRILTITTSLWTKAQQRTETPYFTYTVQIQIGGLADHVLVRFRIDNYVDGGGSNNVDTNGAVTFVHGKIAQNSMGDIVLNENITAKNGTATEQTFKSGKVTFDGSKDKQAYVSEYEAGILPTYTPSLVFHGVAAKLTAEQKTALGVTDEGYYVAFKTSWAEALDDSYSVVLRDLATGEVYTKGYVKYDSSAKTLEVVVPFEGSALYLLDFVNEIADMHQGDVVLDFRQVSLADVSMTAATTANILGGEATLTVEGEVPDGATLHLGSASVAWSEIAEGTEIGGLTVKSVNTQSTTTTVTFTVPAADLENAVTAYEFHLRTATDGFLADASFDTLAIPTNSDDNLVVEGVYVKAEGATLTLVTTTDVTKEATKNIVLNANGGAATVGTDYSLLANLDVSVKISNEGVPSFTASSKVSTNGKLVYSSIGDKAMLVIILNLADINVEEATPYGFQIAVGESAELSSDVYFVAADRTITKTAISELNGTDTDLGAASCTENGYRAKAYKPSGDTATFYYDVTITPAGHTLPADGGLCTRCSEVTGWSKEVKVGTTANNVGFTTEHGDGKAYNPDGKFGSIVQGQTVTAVGKVTSSAVQNYNGFAMLLYPGTSENWVSGTHFRIDNWVNEEAQLAQYSFSMAKNPTLNGKAMDNDAWATLKDVVMTNGEATVVWDWTNAQKIVMTATVVSISTPDTYVQTYEITSTAQDGNFLRTKYSIGLCPDDGSFIGTITATAPVETVSAENCNPDRTCSHVWSEETHKCTQCGEFNPDPTYHTQHGGEFQNGVCSKCSWRDESQHSHTYVNGKCSDCNDICLHTGITGSVDTCPVCGIKATKESDINDFTPGTNGNYGEHSWAKLGENQSLVFTGKIGQMTQVTNDQGTKFFAWMGFIVQTYAFVQDQTSYTGGSKTFQQGNNFSLNPDATWAKNATSGNANPLGESAQLEMEQDRSNWVYQITVSLQNGKLCIVYRAWSGGTVSGDCTHSGVATYEVEATEMAVGFAHDPAANVPIESSSLTRYALADPAD